MAGHFVFQPVSNLVISRIHVKITSATRQLTHKSVLEQTREFYPSRWHVGSEIHEVQRTSSHLDHLEWWHLVSFSRDVQPHNLWSLTQWWTRAQGVMLLVPCSSGGRSASCQLPHLPQTARHSYINIIIATSLVSITRHDMTHTTFFLI